MMNIHKELPLSFPGCPPSPDPSPPFTQISRHYRRNLLAQYVGVYRLSDDYDLVVTLEHDQLFAQITGQGALPIFAETPTEFYYRVVNASLRFERGEDRAVSAVVLAQAGRETRWARER